MRMMMMMTINAFVAAFRCIIDVISALHVTVRLAHRRICHRHKVRLALDQYFACVFRFQQCPITNTQIIIN